MADGSQKITTNARIAATKATHDKLLARARRMFAELPYEQVVMRDIARSAGMSTGAIFGHWPEGKAALWREAMGCEPPVDDALTRLRQPMFDLLKECVDRFSERQHPGWLERAKQTLAAARGEAA